jgi:hypothetical protein
MSSVPKKRKREPVDEQQRALDFHVKRFNSQWFIEHKKKAKNGFTGLGLWLEFKEATKSIKRGLNYMAVFGEKEAESKIFSDPRFTGL